MIKKEVKGDLSESFFPALERGVMLEKAIASHNRKRYIARSAAGIFLAASMALAPDNSEAKTKTPAKKPSIIYILADDAGYGDVGCYGQKDFNTPNIDKMAREGMLFTDHYAGAPVCAPSRCSFLTGKSTGHADIRGNREVLPEGQAPLNTTEITIAEVLKKEGYRTGVIGKWGLGAPGSTGEPKHHGFDYFYGYLCQREAHNYYPDHLWRNSSRENLDEKTYTHDLLTEDAIKFISRNRGDSFFSTSPTRYPTRNSRSRNLGNTVTSRGPRRRKICRDDDTNGPRHRPHHGTSEKIKNR